MPGIRAVFSILSGVELQGGLVSMAKILLEDGTQVVSELRMGDNFWTRFRGLMLDKSLQPNEALLLNNCQAIHCCFMLLEIDVIFLSADGEVLHIVEKMKPWTFSRFVRGATQVLECYPGTISAHGIGVGQKLRVVP